jgi:Zn-dependent peptidase ImmA (M78 family)
VARRRLDPTVAALCAAHDYVGNPEALIGRLVAQMLKDIGGAPPVDLQVIASYCGAVIQHQPIEGDGSIHWDGSSRRYVITLSSLQPPAREPFTLSHETIHIFFMEASGNRSTRIHRDDVAIFDHRGAQEEYLCDVGAAELLMPAATVIAMLPPQPTMEDVLAVSGVCNSSVEATARRVIELSGIPGAVVVLEPSLKPTEMRMLAKREQSPSFLGLGADLPVRKLRVRYATGQGMAYIPPAKSVDDGCPLANILATGSAEFVGLTGLLPRELAVSARAMPFYRRGELVERVVAIAFDAAAWRKRATVSAPRRSGPRGGDPS